MGETLRLRTFGRLEAQWAGKTLAAFESDQTRALLAYLAVEADQPHHRERLTGLLWPEKPEKLARHSLSQALYSLRSALRDGNEYITLTPQAVQFNSQAGLWLDARIFQQRIERAAKHCSSQSWVCQACIDDLELAVGLYQGEFLAGLSLAGCEQFDAWLCVQRETLHLNLVQALERLAASLEGHGALEQALQHARRWAASDNLNDSAQRQVMRLRAAVGQRTEALEQYLAFKNDLWQELGVEPDAETTALYQQIHAAAKRPLLPVRSNLPVPLTPILGRQAELDQIGRKLCTPECRLLTLLGPGGIGKTRLALEAGRRLLRAFPDGVFLVELDDTQGIEKKLLATIARLVGLELRALPDLGGQRQASDLKEQLCDFLSAKKVLLVLDGFEGVLDQAGLVSDLLRRAPAAKVLATSRVRLNLKSEHVLRLDGLAYPQEKEDPAAGGTSPAVKLFLETAQRAAPEFSPGLAEMTAVIDICRLNQGLPLGILLAAAWVGTLAPSHILREIHHSLDFLSAGWRDLPAHQHSMQATFDRSWQSLEPALQHAFLRLAVFQGAFSAARAAQVTGASPAALKTLGEHSLLQPAGEGRFRLHNLLRQYALEKLASFPAACLAVQERHSQVFLETVAACGPRLKNSAQFEALSEMDGELADIRTAWDWAATHGRLNLLHNGARALERYYYLRGLYPDGLCAFQSALAFFAQTGPTAQTRLAWANLSIRLALFLQLCQQYPQAWDRLDQVETCLQPIDADDKTTLLLLAEAGLVKAYIKVNYNTDLQEALALSKRSLEQMRIVGDPWNISVALVSVSMRQAIQSNKRKTEPLAEEALALQGQAGDPELTASIETSLLYIYTMSGQHEKAIRMAEELERFFQRVDTRRSRGQAAMNLGLAYAHAWQRPVSQSYLEQALSLLDPCTDQLDYEFCTYLYALNNLLNGDYAAAQRGLAEYGTGADGMIWPNWQLVQGYLHILDAAYVPAEACLQSFIEFYCSNHRLDVIGHGMALLSYCAYRTDRMEEAHNYLIRTLENTLDQGYFISLGVGLLTLSLILAEAEEIEQAGELFALVDAQFSQQASLYEDIYGKRIRSLIATRPAGNQARSRMTDLHAAAQHYLAKLKSAENLLEALAGAGSKHP